MKNEIKNVRNLMVALEALTMSSGEIAEVVGSRPDNVKRAMERLAERGVITLPPLEETSFTGADGRLQHGTEYRLCKRDSIVVVAQLSPEHTAALVDRWQYLEEQAAAGVVPRPGDGPALPTDVVTPPTQGAASADPLQALLLQNEALRGVIVQSIALKQEMRATIAQVAEVKQGVAELREEIPVLVSNAQARAPLEKRPSKSESMNQIKARYNDPDAHGLPEWVPEHVIRQLTGFCLKPTGQIDGGERTRSDGTTVTRRDGKPANCDPFYVYQIGLVTSAINRFLKGCVRHPTDKRKVIHPAMPDRPFNLNYGYAKGEKRPQLPDAREAAERRDALR